MASRSLYPASGSTEPDMRKELNNTIDGHYPEVAKGQDVLFRKMRIDANGNLTKCPCVDFVTKEPDRDTFCPVCHGEGYLWDETYIKAYKIILRSDVGNVYRETLKPMGLNNIAMSVFFCKSVNDITEKDKLVELILDKEGEITTPITRKALYRVVAAIEYRADNGRLEYWKLDCYEEKRKFLNGVSI